MLEIDRTVRTPVAASRERCRAVLADVERYPQWSQLLTKAEVLERDAQDEATRARLHAAVLGTTTAMDCAIELRDDRALLTRLPYSADDDERFVTQWTLGSGEVHLHVTAALDVPGPARLLRGRVERKLADELLADFAAAL